MLVINHELESRTSRKHYALAASAEPNLQNSAPAPLTCIQVPAVASHIHTVPSWLPVSKTFPTVCQLKKKTAAEKKCSITVLLVRYSSAYAPRSVCRYRLLLRFCGVAWDSPLETLTIGAMVRRCVRTRENLRRMHVPEGCANERDGEGCIVLDMVFTF